MLSGGGQVLYYDFSVTKDLVTYQREKKIVSTPTNSVDSGAEKKGCRFCNTGLEHKLVDLGMSPLCESFVPEANIDSMEPFYPLNVSVCHECYLVQLNEYVSPDEIFTEYAYFSSYSTSWVEHAKNYCHKMKDRFDLGQDSLVVELASNDGYLLQHFLPLNVPVLGIEPAANVAKVAEEKGVTTVVEFFGVELANTLKAEGKSADIIAGNNVLAQVPDLNDFVGGIKILLGPDGVCTLEWPHLEKLMDENQFDTIYHEHFSYFSFVTMDKIAKGHGLRLFDVEELPTHGGSLRVYMTHKDNTTHEETPAVQALLGRERDRGFTDMKTYADYTEKVCQTKRKMLACLIELKDQGKVICGYGAPGKGNTLLNYCGIGTDFLDFTVDRNPYKHGMYTPGMHIPIYPVEKIDEVKPDYLFILPWNLKKEIMNQMKHISEWGGKFIIPIPEVHIIDPSEI